MHEYQSVRRRPGQDQIENAERIYRALKQGKTPSCIRPARIGFCACLMWLMMLAIGVTGLLATWQPLVAIPGGMLLAAVLLHTSLRPFSELAKSSLKQTEIAAREGQEVSRLAVKQAQLANQFWQQSVMRTF